MNSNTWSGISAYEYLIKSMNNKQETISNFICPVCGNTDIHSIGYLNGKPYCHRCISFKGEEVEQKELSDKLVKNHKKGIDSLVFEVCRSPKQQIRNRKEKNLWKKN